MRAVVERECFEKSKAVLPLRRHALKRRDVGYDEFVSSLVTAEDWIYEQAMRKAGQLTVASQHSTSRLRFGTTPMAWPSLFSEPPYYFSRMELSLLDGERLLHQSTDHLATLTTHRVRLHRATGSTNYLISVMLEKISSCEMRYLSYPWMLLAGGLLVLGGLVALFQRVEPVAVALLLLLGGVLMVAYFASRRHVVSIASDGGTRLSFETKGMRREVVMGFIDNVEQAKNQRMLLLGR